MRSKRPRPTPPDHHRCLHLKADGSRCKAWRVTGLLTCIHHTPERTTKPTPPSGHQNNRKTGFRAQSIKPLTTPEAVNDDLTLRHLQLYLYSLYFLLSPAIAPTIKEAQWNNRPGLNVILI